MNHRLTKLTQSVSLALLATGTVLGAEFRVQTTGDMGGGAANLVAPDVYEVDTLRTAIELAGDENLHPGPDLITFNEVVFSEGHANINVASVGDTFSRYGDVSNSGFGINTAITISGPDSENELNLSAQSLRHFQVNDNGQLTLENLTMKDGFAPDNFSGVGGSVLVIGSGQLDLRDSIITGSSAFNGGAINFRLTTNSSNISNTVFSYNDTLGTTAGGGFGGAIAMQNSGLITIDSSTFTHNSARDFGGALIVSGLSKITNSTIANNTSYGNAGGVGVNNIGVLELVNSTVSGNLAERDGGGLFVGTYGNTSSLINNTITNNRSSVVFKNTPQINKGDSVPLNSSGGGVIARNAENMILHNNLIAGNFDTSAFTPDDLAALPVASSSHNLIGGGDSILGLFNGINGNQIGTTLNPINALISPLSDNGGITATHDVDISSPAVNAGSDIEALSQNLVFDQRGTAFRRQVGQVDIGAIENQDLIYDDGFE